MLGSETGTSVGKRRLAPESNEATCGAVAQHASGTCTSSKQSGVPGVSWHGAKSCWQVSWYEEKKGKRKYFHVHHFMNTSKTFCEAEADALRAAIEFRKGLERSGVVKAKHVENPHSGVPGVLRHTRYKAWEVTMNINGQIRFGGKFRPKDSTPEEIERARLLAVENRRKLEF